MLIKFTVSYWALSLSCVVPHFLIQKLLFLAFGSYTEVR